MAENSKIEWCDATVNMWWGCTKVSPGCAYCYADTWSKRCGKDIWGPGRPREDHRAGATKLAMRLERAAAEGRFRECFVCGKREIRKWDRTLPPGGLACCSNPECVSLPETESSVVRPRVFCSSMSDWLDGEVPIEWLADLLQLVGVTPHLDWLLLSKRPQNWRPRMEGVYTSRRRSSSPVVEMVEAWIAQCPPANVWMGTSVEDQQRADERIPHLLTIPARVRFLSCEPLLGPVDLNRIHEVLTDGHGWRTERWESCLNGRRFSAIDDGDADGFPKVDWVVAGGESGSKARPLHPEWVRSLRDQCKGTGVAFLLKQWGAWLPYGQCAPGVPDPSDADPGVLHNYNLGITAPSEQWYSRKLGKARAGRLLDGREHNDFPDPTTNNHPHP